MGHLDDVLISQQMRLQDEQSLRAIRDRIEEVLTGGWTAGNPRFYYAGSFGKKTMIRESFDLDIVVYFAPGSISVKAYYEAVEGRLRRNYTAVNRHNVALRLPFEGGFHVDIVPGRAQDSTYKYATLYASDTNATKQTSIKVHIDLVRNGEYQDIIKLLKLWRLRNNIPVGTFALELIVHEALSGDLTVDLGARFATVFTWIRDNILTARLIDPANSGNVVSDEIPFNVKQTLKTAAIAALAKQYWYQVVW